MGWRVESLTTRKSTRIEEFLDELSGDARAEGEALLELLAEYGSTLRPPQSKALGDGLFEARGFEHGIRVFYIFRPQKRVLVLGGYQKKRQAIPTQVLRQIRRLHRQALAAEEASDE